MKALVVYDSFFGNTEKIALAIGEALKEDDTPVALRVNEASQADLNGLDLLIVGSPTRKFQASPSSKSYIKKMPRGQLNGVMVAAFDTRVSVDDIKGSFLRFMVDNFGYAAAPLARLLKSKGGEEITRAEGFFVNDTEGPLKEGELERAKSWGMMIRQLVIQALAEGPDKKEPA